MIYALNFLIGTLLGIYYPNNKIGILLMIILLIFILLRKTFIARLFLLFCLGFSWSWFYGKQTIAEQLAPQFLNEKITISGIVNDLPKISARKTQFNFSAVAPFNAKLKLSWYHKGQTPTLKVGDKWRLTVKLKQNNGFHNELGFDYETWLFAKGFSASGYVINKADNQLQGTTNQYLLNQLRQNMSQSLLRVLKPFNYGGIIYALISGNRNFIKKQQWQQFIRTNTSHLTVVSGLHIGLISGFIYFLALWGYRRCARCCLWIPAPIFASLIGIIAALIYASLAGFSIATQRAFIMASVVFLSIILRQHIAIWHLYAIALILVILFNPLSALSVGFWLSFIAVAIILYGISRYRYQKKWQKFFNIQILISLLMLPILLLFFKGAGLTSIPANLVAVPLISFIALPLSLAASSLIFIGLDSIAYGLFYIADVSLSILNTYLSFLSQFDSAYIHWRIGALELIFLFLAMLLLFLPKGLKLNWFALIVLLAILYPKQSSLEHGQIKVNVFDVGQGLAIFIQTKSQNILFDSGFANQTFSVAEAVIKPFLDANHIKKLHTLIISHSDNDHSGGVPTLLPYLKNSAIIASSDKNITAKQAITFCRAGQSWQRDGVVFTILNPPDIAYKKDNNNSCVLKISNKKYSILLSGDIEKKAEENLIKTYGSALKSTILIVPHHGSETSSTPAFLKVISPTIAINSSGFNNRFRHPRPSVKQNYLKNNIAFYDTQCSGQITLMIDSTTITMQQSRPNDNRYWIRQCL